MSDCKQFYVNVSQFILNVNFSDFLFWFSFFFPAEKDVCHTCGSLTPKKVKHPIEEPRTPNKEPEKSEKLNNTKEEDQKKPSAFKRLGSLLRKKPKDESQTKK